MMRASTPPPMYIPSPFRVQPFRIFHSPEPSKPPRAFAALCARGTCGVNDEGDGHATTRSEEGYEASPSVRAREGVRAGARGLGGRGGGDRRPYRQQAARAKRRGDGIVEAVARGHLIRTSRWASQPNESASWTHARPAVRGGEGPQHPRSLEDDEGRAPSRARRSSVTSSARRTDAREGRSTRSRRTVRPCSPGRR